MKVLREGEGEADMKTEMKIMIPQIKPYVTDKGGVVILNEPFSIDRALRVANLCEAAPDLLKAVETALLVIKHVGGWERCRKQIEAAIAKAERK